jgi:hypothetical protein
LFVISVDLGLAVAPLLLNRSEEPPASVDEHVFILVTSALKMEAA